jgi:hypothetical protein
MVADARTEAALVGICWELTQFQLGALLLACLSGKRRPTVGVVTMSLDDDDGAFLSRMLADPDDRWQVARVAEEELARRNHPDEVTVH